MAAAAPYIVAAIGTAASINAQNEAASERRRILNQQLDANEAATDKAADLVKKEAQNYTGDARQQAMAAQEDAAYKQSQVDLKGAGANIIDTAGGAGNVSADFIKAQADRQISEGTRLTGLAREAAKVRAPSLLGQTEAQRRANLAGELQSTASTNRNLSSAAGADASTVEAPAYGQIGSLIGNLGSAYLNNSMVPGQPGFAGTQKPASIFDRSFRG